MQTEGDPRRHCMSRGRGGGGEREGEAAEDEAHATPAEAQKNKSKHKNKTTPLKQEKEPLKTPGGLPRGPRSTPELKHNMTPTLPKPRAPQGAPVEASAGVSRSEGGSYELAGCPPFNAAQRSSGRSEEVGVALHVLDFIGLLVQKYT